MLHQTTLAPHLQSKFYVKTKIINKTGYYPVITIASSTLLSFQRTNTF